MLRKLLLALAIAMGCVLSVSAQVGQGTVKGKILDEETGEPVPFANVALMDGSDQILGTTTNFDGEYTLKPIPPGTYDIQISYVGYQTRRIAGVSVTSDRITEVDGNIAQGIALETVEITEYTKPLFEKDQTTVEETKTREEIQRMAVRSASDIAKTAGNGVFARDDGTGDLNVRGARDGNNVTFIDGIKVIGSSSLPKSAIEEVTVKTGGLSAQYGDLTGGVTSITTRGAFKEYFGSAEYLTSGFKTGENQVTGFDNYGYNLVGFSLGGPILTNKDENGKILDAPLGFLLTAEYRNILNPRPAAVQLYKPRDEVEELIQNDPYIGDFQNQAVLKRAEFLREEDFEEIDFQRNVRSRTLVLNAKIDLKINDFSSMSFGGTYNTNRNNSDVRNGTYNFQLFNYANNPYNEVDDYRMYVRYTQRFANAEGEEDNKSLVSNAFFSVQADFSRRTTAAQHEDHRDDFFKYGYVGRFEAITEPSYQYQSRPNGAGVPQGFLLPDGNYYTGYFLDAFDSPQAYEYTPGDVNPVLASYTQSFYNLLNASPIQNNPATRVDTREEVEGGGGIVNGGVINNSIYNLWSAPGTVNNLYGKSERDQYRLSGRGSADIGDHAIMLGFEYEQRVERNFSMNPLGLWQLGRGTVNSHISQIDSSRFSVDQLGSDQRITFERRIDLDNRSYFAYNFRKALGLDPNGGDFIDFDSYDIDTYNMEFFSADQLINPSNSVNLQYRGYTYKGRRTSEIPTLDDFFNETIGDGINQFKTRPVAPYQPIYIAGYIEDKFAFDDLVFRVGLRLDRFDANQPVLKDQFSFFPTQNAAFARQEGASVPGNIGDDYVVYVQNIENPSADAIVGYRDPETNTFFNDRGEELNDSRTLEQGGGIAPWLRNPSARNLSSDLTSESFEDYEPQYTLMPRISFSFPISDEATFFANYDILTQRPSGNVALDPIDIITIENHNRIMNNPSLKPTKTISYELGFKQKLSNSSALTLSAFYKEQRDEIQVVRRGGAHPVDYRTYDNLDFGTVKGFTFNYDLRRVKNIQLRVNYTLQFAEGTGSGSLTSLNLVNSQQPNLRSIFPYSYDQRHAVTASIDYRYARGKRYNGPKIAGKNIFEDAGVNLQIVSGSGTPYTSRTGPRDQESINPQNNRQPIIGGINGSRLPWTFRVDARIDKNFILKWGGDSEANQTAWKEGKKTSVLNVYFQILNLFDAQNIQSVYAYTGNPDDDGYLTADQFQTQIQQQLDEQSYRDQYRIALQNMYNYELPRRIRLGLQLNF